MNTIEDFRHWLIANDTAEFYLELPPVKEGLSVFHISFAEERACYDWENNVTLSGKEWWVEVPTDSIPNEFKHLLASTAVEESTSN